MWASSRTNIDRSSSLSRQRQLLSPKKRTAFVTAESVLSGSILQIVCERTGTARRLDAGILLSYAKAQRFSYGSRNHDRILHRLKLRASRRRSDGETPQAQATYWFAE